MTVKRFLLGVLILALLAPPAAAAPTAKELFERAKAAYVQAQAERSLELLRRAALSVREIKLSAAIELYIGLNLLVMNKRDEAKAAFQRALRHDPTLSLDADLFKPSTVKLLESIKAAARGTLVITANRPGKVSIDGVERGTTPLTVRVKIGKHQIQVRAGVARFEATVVIGAGVQLTVPAHLPLASSSTAPPVGKPAVVSPKPKPKPRGPTRLWTWITLGTAVAAAGAGVTFGLLAKSDHEDYLTTLDYDRFAAAESGAKTKAMLANVFFVGAGVLAAGAIALFFIEGRAGAKERASSPEDDKASGDADLQVRVVPSFTPAGGGVSVDLRF